MSAPANMAGIPHYHAYSGPALFSEGFRPFFLLAAVWAAVAVPLWLAIFSGVSQVPNALSPALWHGHEMVYGYASAVVAGFLLTAIPNWTGRMPLQGSPLILLVVLWIVGRVAELSSAWIGPGAAAALDLAFPVAFLAAVGREIVAARNRRNLPMLLALALLLAGNVLVHLEALRIAPTGEVGLRLGVATLLMLISLVGGRIIPSFTRNWLMKQSPNVPMPVTPGPLDLIVLTTTGVALVAWVALPASLVSPWLALTAGLLQAARLARWGGHRVLREPLLWVLHLGYAWVAIGFLLQAASALFAVLPPTAALHAFTAGAIGIMPLAVMTRATLGHTSRQLHVGIATATVYGLVTVAALARVGAFAAGTEYLQVLIFSGEAWCLAFALFLAIYVKALIRPPYRGQPLGDQSPGRANN